MLRRARRSEDVLADFRSLLTAALESVDTVLHSWDDLAPEQRRAVGALAPDAAALARRIENVVGRFPPRDGREWDEEEDDVVVPLPRPDQDQRRAEDLQASSSDPKLWLERLNTSLAPMRRAIDVPDLYARLSNLAVSMLASDACIVSTYDPERRILRDVAASAPGPAPLNIVVEEYDIDDFPATKQVIERGVSLEISASDPEADAIERNLLTHLGFARVLVCPLSMGEVDAGTATGTIEIYRTTNRPFRQDDFQRVEAITGFAASVYARIRVSEQLQGSFSKTIEALTSAVEARHAETQEHTQRIKNIALALADAMKLPPELRRKVQLGAILHDVGKIGVPDAILLKPGPLDPDEFETMKAHPDIGTRLIAGIDFLQPALSVVRHHHERWDGNGYPDGLREEDIPVEARIVALCDAFDAMTSDRPYRAAVSLDEACNEIRSCAGSQFDPEIASLLIAIVKRIGVEDLENKFVRYAG